MSVRRTAPPRKIAPPEKRTTGNYGCSENRTTGKSHHRKIILFGESHHHGKAHHRKIAPPEIMAVRKIAPPEFMAVRKIAPPEKRTTGKSHHHLIMGVRRTAPPRKIAPPEKRTTGKAHHRKIAPPEIMAVRKIAPPENRTTT